MKKSSKKNRQRVLTATEAYVIVKRHNPDMEVFSCYEYPNCYAFGLKPKGWIEIPATGTSCYTVDKYTGNYTIKSILDLPYNNEHEIGINTLIGQAPNSYYSKESEDEAIESSEVKVLSTNEVYNLSETQ